MQIYLDANPVHCQLCFSKMATLMRANFLLSAGASPPGGRTSRQILKRGQLDRTSQFLEGVAGKEEVTFFWKI